jgi:hypothetical protein
VARRRFGFVVQFIGCLILVATSNYSSFTILRELQITTTFSNCSHSAMCSRIRCLLTASHNGYSSASVLTSLQAVDWLTSNSYGRSVDRNIRLSICRACWPLPAQAFLASDVVEIYDQDFCSLLDMYVLRSGVSIQSKVIITLRLAFTANHFVLATSPLRSRPAMLFPAEHLRL